jgi:hypothetical protein
VKDVSINSRHADAYFVLGQLYRELPGWPLSFGNTDFAVSLGRLAVDLRVDQVKKGVEKSLAYNFYTELGKTLHKRNRSAVARVSSQKAERTRYDAAKNDLDRGCSYEGTVTLQNISDREEARALVQFAVTELEKKQARTYDDNDDLDKAREVLKGW